MKPPQPEVPSALAHHTPRISQARNGQVFAGFLRFASIAAVTECKEPQNSGISERCSLSQARMALPRKMPLQQEQLSDWTSVNTPGSS